VTQRKEEEIQQCDCISATVLLGEARWIKDGDKERPDEADFRCMVKDLHFHLMGNVAYELLKVSKQCLNCIC
jgi:hypothetical protein